MANLGIVFDLDGTLVDSLSFTLEAFNYGIVSQGGKALPPTEIMKFFGPGEGDIFSAILGEAKSVPAYLAYQRFVDDHLMKMPLHAGVPELLEQLKSAGVPIAIFTGRSWPTTEAILKHQRLLDRFVTIVASDHVNMPKPSPEGLHLALSRMKLRPSEALFVGDSHFDMQAARAAGSRGVAALWDLLADRKSLEKQSPHHWAKSPDEIFEIYRGISERET
jgi:HAD superfamily hydrolase (TIGR01509 family)